MGRNRKKNKKIQERPPAGGTSYEDIVKCNKDLEAYYKLQKICPENEWDDFMTALQSGLPTAFRITNYKSEAKVLLNIVQGQYFKDIINNEKKEDGIESIEPVALPWYPDNLAWQLKLTRKHIRGNESYFKLHNFLISETESGNISRQEVVSMIPPIVLDIKSHHKILDMCAAPGSKTAQLIEYLHKDEERLPKGFVVANDIDNNRCYLLVHQAKRLSSPNVIVTNHDSAIMPNFITVNEGKEEVLKFDRILCDVPCTGDGTLRKNPDIWTKWNTANGNNLHGVQFRILKRGCEMLEIGGRIVYSTCSLNPLENEAVIMRLLLEAKGSVKLIDLSPHLPGLKYSRGLTDWTPTSRDLVGYRSFDEVPEKWHTVVRPQMFPPPKEVAEEHHLDYCIRVLPHHQDTGAFFVAALEKVQSLPWETSRTPANESEENGEEKKQLSVEPARKKRRVYGYREDPYIFFDDDEPVWKEIKEFYEISDELQGNTLLTRCKEGKKKNIYLTSPQVRELVLKNGNRIKIINTGVKTFARCDMKDMKCSFRLAQEGLWSIYPFIGPRRKVEVTKDDLLLMLTNDNPKYPLETTRLDPKTQKIITSIGPGSCVLVYKEEPVTESSLHLEMVGWIGAMSTRAYIPLSDCIHFLRLLGGDTSKFDVNKFKKPSAAEEETETTNGNESPQSKEMEP